MPFILASIALQVLCLIHAVRNGNTQPWLYIILFAPMIGCALYFFMVMMPEWRTSRDGQQAARTVGRIIDPHRDYRERVREAELVGSADSKRHLAEECMRRGDYADAAALYENALQGAHRDDPTLLFGLARSRLAAGDAVRAEKALDDLRTANPDFQSPDAHLVYARAKEEQDKDGEALAEYEALVRYYPGEEAKCRYALLLLNVGRAGEARDVFAGIVKSVEGASRHYREAQKDWYQLARRNLPAA